MPVGLKLDSLYALLNYASFDFLRPTVFNSFMKGAYHIEASPLICDWFLYDRDNRHERVKPLSRMAST